MSKYGDENKMIMITPESLMTQYAERMACFSYCCKECMEVAKKFRENNRDEVDSYIKNICDGKYPLHFILGLNSVQNKNAVVMMACILYDCKNEPMNFINEVMQLYIKNSKRQGLPSIDENALMFLYRQIENDERDDKQKCLVAYNAFTQNLINTPTRAFFAAHAPRYQNFEKCYKDIYLNAFFALKLIDASYSVNSISHTERYNYLTKTIVSKRFSGKNLSTTFTEDARKLRYTTLAEKADVDEYTIPLTGALNSSGILNSQSMDEFPLTKDMLTSISIIAYKAAHVDDGAVPLEKVWKEIDQQEKSTYDDKIIEEAENIRNKYKAALFNATYYTFLSEKCKKAIRETLSEYFFNPQGKRLDNELKKCQTRIKQDKELIAKQESTLDEYHKRLEVAEKNAEIARNRYASIQSKVETQQSEIECLKKQLEDLKAQNEELSRAIPEREEAEKIDLPEEPKIDYVGCLTKVFESKKVVFIGGHQNIMTKFAQKFPKAVVVTKDKSITAENQIDNADAILFKTDNMGHKEYNPIKDIAVRRNIPYGYIGDVTALELVEKSVFEELERLGCSL